MRIDVLHPTTLLGKEVRERLGEARRLAGEVRLLSDREAEVGTLTDVGGAAAVVARLEDDWAPGDLVLFCGPLAATRTLLPRLASDATAVVLSPGATDADGRATVAGVNDDEARPGRILVSPGAETVALARLLHPLRGAGIASVVATAIAPASQGDEDALHELFEQGRSILTFAPQPPSPLLGGQLAFNVAQALTPSDDAATQLAGLLGGVSHVAIQTLVAGIFHGAAVSAHVRLERDPGAKAVREAIRSAPGIELAAAGRRIGAIDAAQSEQLLVGDIRKDPRQPGAYWFWATLDNLTAGGAQNALQVAEAAFS